MARARNIKPGLYRNEEIIELPIAARYLFTGLWTMADRRGRLEDRPKKIRLEILPYDDIDVDELLDGLAGKGFLIRYQVDGTGYIQIVNFEKHQRPHQNESESTIPPPPCHGVPSLDSNTSHHGDKDGTPRDTALRSDSLIPECLNLNADGADVPDAPARKPHPDAPPDDDPAVVAASEILSECAWVRDDMPNIQRGVARAFGLVAEFDRGQAAIEAESYGRHWAKEKKPPADWYAAWLNWLKNWVKFRERDMQRPASKRNGRIREPDFSGIEAFSETMSALEQRR